ncbi:ABC transporter substrate-binding protein, partial [Chloroflexota bacterium]
LAESWEIIDSNTVVWHIRKGINWQDKDPVFGRRFDAHDVEYGIKRQWNMLPDVPRPRAYMALTSQPGWEEVYATDDWTVVTKAPPGYLSFLTERMISLCNIIPREVDDVYGGMREWRNVVGTGPYILTDYVPQSTATLTKNPNYWRNDPLHPENRLPYIDTVVFYMIPDWSTKLAAMRTGKLDFMKDLVWDDAESLMKTNPELGHLAYLQNNWCFQMRIDKPELPWYDKNVRVALHMGTDLQEISDSVYGGHAEIHCQPVRPTKEFMHLYIPIEELPENIREHYVYNPEKAKQMLAEAGYPDGFSCKILTYDKYVDGLSVLQDQWTKIGVDLEIEVKEYSVYNSIFTGKTHEQAVARSCTTVNPYFVLDYRQPNIHNIAMIDDPYIYEAFAKMSEYSLTDPAKKDEIYNEFQLYVLDNCYHIQAPCPENYSFWQPWLKGTEGAWSVGYNKREGYGIFAWIDQDLKEELTGKR